MTEQKEMPTERPGIFKTETGLINKDNNALQAYKMKKRKMQEIDSLKDEFYSMKSDLAEIKRLLEGLIK